MVTERVIEGREVRNECEREIKNKDLLRGSTFQQKYKQVWPL